MSPVSAIVLLAVIWFLTLFVVLPIGHETQGDIGERVEGTSEGSPSSNFSMKRKLKQATIWAVPIWAVVAAIVVWGPIGVRDIDFFDRMGPAFEDQ